MSSNLDFANASPNVNVVSLLVPYFRYMGNESLVGPRGPLCR